MNIVKQFAARRTCAALHGWCVIAAFAVGSTAPAVRAGADPENCLLCHQFRGLSRFDAQTGRVRVFSINPEYVHARLGPHARIACTDCHDRNQVGVIPHEPVRPVDCTRPCHLVDPNGLERRFSHENVAAMLEAGTHRPALLAEVQLSEGALLATGQSTCLYCHDEPLFRDATNTIPALRALGGRLYDRCDVCHAETVPADIAYYVRHIAARLQPARPTLELAQVCAVCHSDRTFLAARALPDAVASYVRSFHGKAALLGDTTTANCLSCHVAAGQNAHLMFSRSDPRSSVHPARLANSCRSTACHPGSDPQIAAFAVHLDLPTARGTLEFALAAAFILLTVATFGPSALIVLLELGQILIGRHHERHQELRDLTAAVLAHPDGRRRLTRFTVSQRVQHWVLVVLFALLALTGFPMKFADRAWAATCIGWFGGLTAARIVHHWAGLALMFGLAGHIVYVVVGAVRWRTARLRSNGTRTSLVQTLNALPMWVGPTDARKGLQLLAYLLCLRSEPPGFGRFNVKEKFEYIGVFWGTILLGVTGVLVWGQQVTSHFIGGRWFNIALIAHTYEAFLAVIHVGILHIVNVIFSPNAFPLSLATITGTTPASELAESHREMVVEAARELGIGRALPAAEETGHA